jgi:hypothetical protein
MGVQRLAFRGLDLLRDSLQQGAGVLLTPNHSRWPDPCVMGMLSIELNRFFYYAAAYHLFKQSRLTAWWMNRTGAYSILREGLDREAIWTTVDILTRAERPVVLFPEGTWYRQNDRLGPLQKGVTFIARQAARVAKRPILVHPVAIKYWLLEDPRPVLCERLAKLEENLAWHPQRHLDLLPRLAKLGNALLTLKEIEFHGEGRDGPVDERIRDLTDGRVAALEATHLGKQHDGSLMERIRRLRQHLVRRLPEVSADSPEGPRLYQALDDLLLCENLSCPFVEYLQDRPSPERLMETLQRIEETLTDGTEVQTVPLGAVVEVGPALNILECQRGAVSARQNNDPFLQQLGSSIQGMLTRLLAQGPPAEWNCPPVVVNGYAGSLSGG